MELFEYYTLDEVYEYRSLVMNKLNILKENNKINYKIEDIDILFIEDLGMDEIEIDDLINFFDQYDVFEYSERKISELGSHKDDGYYIDDDFINYDDV